MKKKISYQVLCTNTEDCPLEMDNKIGMFISWTDVSKVRCSICTFFNGVELEDDIPKHIICGFKNTIGD